MVEIFPKQAGCPCPVVKRSRAYLLRADLRKVYDGLIQSSGVRAFRILHPGVTELVRFFEGIMDARTHLSSQSVIESDYWHYTREAGYA